MTKYEQIAKRLEQKILNHEYRQGERLPSIIKLSKENHCSKATIIRSYDYLIQKHLIYVKNQSGYYVADGLLKSNDIDDGFSLETGNPVVSKTSLIDAKHCMSVAIDQYSNSSLNMSLQGVESLRDILPAYLENLAIYAKKECIYLIQGVTQMLSFLTYTDFLNKYSTILIEEPTYSYYVQFLKDNHIPVLTIPRDETGIDLEMLEDYFKNKHIKFFYVIPRNHNPLGTTLPAKTRKKIAELAIKYNVYIIEDDYFGHCSSTPRYLPIYYYMNGENCIYLTSFSKTIPYIRIGICVIHSQFKQVFEKMIHKSYYYSYQLPSLISQATLESYIRSSLYDKQSKILMNALKQNVSIIKKNNKKWDHNLAYIVGGQSGYYLSLMIHKDIHLDDLQTHLLKHHIKIARNERCFYYPQHFNHSIRLSLARIQADDLDKALTIIYQLLLEEYYKITT